MSNASGVRASLSGSLERDPRSPANREEGAGLGVERRAAVHLSSLTTEEPSNADAAIFSMWACVDPHDSRPSSALALKGSKQYIPNHDGQSSAAHTISARTCPPSSASEMSGTNVAAAMVRPATAPGEDAQPVADGARAAAHENSWGTDGLEPWITRFCFNRLGPGWRRRRIDSERDGPSLGDELARGEDEYAFAGALDIEGEVERWRATQRHFGGTAKQGCDHPARIASVG